MRVESGGFSSLITVHSSLTTAPRHSRKKNGPSAACTADGPFCRVYTVLSIDPFRLAERASAGVNDPTLAGDKGRRIDDRSRRHRRGIATFESRSRHAVAHATFATAARTGDGAAIAGRFAATLLASEDAVEQVSATALRLAALRSSFTAARRSHCFAGRSSYFATARGCGRFAALRLAAAIEIEQRLTALRLAARLGFAAAAWSRFATA